MVTRLERRVWSRSLGLYAARHQRHPRIPERLAPNTNLALWQLRAVESARLLQDLVGTANLLPINPHETKPRLLIPGPYADGLAVQLAGKTSVLLP